MILVQLKGITGDCLLPDHKGWVSVESFSFGVEREIAESGKAGSGDINLGIGEIQEAEMSKSYDRASAEIMEKGISGGSIPEVQVHFIETIEVSANKSVDRLFLGYKMKNVFIKQWSQSGSADERPEDTFSLFFYGICATYFPKTVKDGVTLNGQYDPQIVKGWDRVSNKQWLSEVTQLS